MKKQTENLFIALKAIRSDLINADMALCAEGDPQEHITAAQVKMRGLIRRIERQVREGKA